MCRDDAPRGNRGLDEGLTSHIAYLYFHLCLALSNANKKDFSDPSGSRRRISFEEMKTRPWEPVYSGLFEGLEDHLKSGFCVCNGDCTRFSSR